MQNAYQGKFMCLIVNKLNLFNILFLFILSFFKIKICFLETSQLFRFRLFFSFLEKLNFIWLNQDFHGVKLTPKINYIVRYN